MIIEHELRSTVHLHGAPQTVDKVRGDAADFSYAKEPQIQYLSEIETLFIV